jgi:hypothetical protein
MYAFPVDHFVRDSAYVRFVLGMLPYQATYPGVNNLIGIASCDVHGFSDTPIKQKLIEIPLSF